MVRVFQSFEAEHMGPLQVAQKGQYGDHCSYAIAHPAWYEGAEAFGLGNEEKRPCHHGHEEGGDEGEQLVTVFPIEVACYGP